MQDSLDIIKNIESIYNSNTSFKILKDFERVIDHLDLYVYENWKDGEIAEGPKIGRHWVTCSFFWPQDKMPDPMGGKRLLDYDCKVSYKKTHLIVPRKIESPDDVRPGTKKGKLDRKPIWIVEIKMTKKLMADIYTGNMDIMDNTSDMPASTPEPQQAEQQVADAPDTQGEDV